jgi:uncharacterized membrane protein
VRYSKVAFLLVAILPIFSALTAEDLLNVRGSDNQTNNDPATQGSLVIPGEVEQIKAMTSLSMPGSTTFLPMIVAPHIGTTTLISRQTDGTSSDSGSFDSSISADGRFVAFTSYGTNLVDDDTNKNIDVFVHDRLTGETTMVSRHTDGTQGNYESYDCSISADGRFVAFTSRATNLVDNDANGAQQDDVFVHDRLTGETTMISRHTNGIQGNLASGQSSISADGRFVVFSSEASNLVDNDTNNKRDAFVHDRDNGETMLVSRHTDGTLSNDISIGTSISGNGRLVAFDSLATNIVNNDNNNGWDIFVHDMQTGYTTLVTRASDGEQGSGSSPAISSDGRLIAFISGATNLVDDDIAGTLDVFVHDLQTGETTKVSRHSDGSHGNNRSEEASISADGKFVAFSSESSNLVDHDANNKFDIFVHDLKTGKTTLVSRATGGEQGTEESNSPSISADGRFVAFESYAPNLAYKDLNGKICDIFVRDREE